MSAQSAGAELRTSKQCAIDAARGLPPFDRIAFDYFNNSDCIFLTSPFVRLETVPKAAYMRLEPELDFYNAFFNHPEIQYCRDWNGLEKTADGVARQSGLSAMHALHVAAASLLGADELVTTERHRSQSSAIGWLK